MKKAIGLALVVLATSALAASAQASQNAPTRAAAFSCGSTMKIGFPTPLTGGASFLGNEQLSWAKYAVKSLAPRMGLRASIVVGDTPVEQGPAPAQSVAQKFIADPKVIALIGPSTSGSVAASSTAYFQAGMAHVSPSATRTS